jgi:plastocyanin
MKFLYVVIALVIVSGATVTTAYSVDYQIPSWTKNVALYWGEGEIEDGEYIEFLQFLVDEEIITIPNDNSTDVSQLENKVASLESEISSLKGSIASDLQSAYDDGYDDGAEFTPVADQSGTATITSLENQITSLEAEISILNSEITSLENQIADMEEASSLIPDPTVVLVPTVVEIITVDESGFSQACVDDGCYVPSNLTANVGDTIVMTNTDPTGVHTYTSGTVNGFTPSPDGTFDSGVLMSGDAFEWTPTQTGDIPYYCMLHTWMTGNISVN